MTPRTSWNPARWTPALAAALGLFLAGCDSGQIAAPVSTGVQWTRITNPATANSAKYPDWRGQRIAFAYLSGSSANIAICQEDGTGLTYLSRGSRESQLEPRWVDDSTLIFTHADSAGAPTSYDLWLRVLTTDQIQRLTQFPNNEFSPAPRPGTTGVAYTEQAAKGRIVLIPDYTIPTPERFYLTGSGLDCGEPDWDPAGQRICFTADSASNYRHVWMVTLAPGDSTPVQLTTGPYFDVAPRFSPDGSRILFVSGRLDNHGALVGARTGRPGLWTITPEGAMTSLRLVAFDDAGSMVATPCWSPDGTKVLVASLGHGGQALWVLSNLP